MLAAAFAALLPRFRVIPSARPSGSAASSRVSDHLHLESPRVYARAAPYLPLMRTADLSARRLAYTQVPQVVGPSSASFTRANSSVRVSSSARPNSSASSICVISCSVCSGGSTGCIDETNPQRLFTFLPGFLERVFQQLCFFDPPFFEFVSKYLRAKQQHFFYLFVDDLIRGVPPFVSCPPQQVNGRLAQARLRAFPPPPLLRYPARRASGSAVSWYSFDTNTVPSTQRNSSALARVIAAVTSASPTQDRRSPPTVPMRAGVYLHRKQVTSAALSPPKARPPACREPRMLASCVPWCEAHDWSKRPSFVSTGACAVAEKRRRRIHPRNRRQSPVAPDGTHGSLSFSPTPVFLRTKPTAARSSHAAQSAARHVRALEARGGLQDPLAWACGVPHARRLRLRHAPQRETIPPHVPTRAPRRPWSPAPLACAMYVHPFVNTDQLLQFFAMSIEEGKMLRDDLQMSGR
ncbi:hypothetical protein C8J57DRAFT_1470269 [Mycena rebaudengoi]|nr:hypothetical protein C8J57DRAFT_1470269 [Mycena rebaudengoi]